MQKNLKRSFLIIILSVIFVGSLYTAQERFRRIILVKGNPGGFIKGVNGEYIENETDGIWNFTNTIDSVGNALLTGVPVKWEEDMGTLAQTWFWQADTDNAIKHNQDIQLKYVRLHYSLATGDSIILALYDTSSTMTNVGNDTTAGPGSGWKLISIGLDATSQLDASAGEGWALNVLEKGTADSVQVIVEGVTYDVQ